MKKPTERSLTNDEQSRLLEDLRNVCKYVGLEYGKCNPDEMVNAVSLQVDKFRQTNQFPDGFDEMSFDWAFGILWGQALCDSAGWQWALVTGHPRFSAEKPLFGLVSPERETMILCDLQMERWRKGSTNTPMSMFGMVSTRALFRDAGQYMWLG